MRKATICFCLKGKTVLLAIKNRGFGEGKWNGYGGRVEELETPKEAAVRELCEESSLISKTDDLEQVALINFSFEGILKFECHVFITQFWEGEPKDSKEMVNPTYFPFENLPKEMWAADTMWIPKVLNGEKIKAYIDFSADGSTVKSFTCEPTIFN
ncbi:MAG: NUDIX domain-containing protein [bacterium]